jgi:PilZ domain
MSEVLLYERATSSLAMDVAKRGHHIIYRVNEANRCPGCGRSHWYIGRVSAECGFCGTAVPLAETSRREAAAGSPRSRSPSLTADQRQHPRMRAKGRKLKLLVDGSPSSFAIHNISEGGVMGDLVADLTPGTSVHVRFEGGILVPAVVRWVDGGLLGLGFEEPVILDRSDQPRD